MASPTRGISPVVGARRKSCPLLISLPLCRSGTLGRCCWPGRVGGSAPREGRLCPQCSAAIYPVYKLLIFVLVGSLSTWSGKASLVSASLLRQSERGQCRSLHCGRLWCCRCLVMIKSSWCQWFDLWCLHDTLWHALFWKKVFVTHRLW